MLWRLATLLVAALVAGGAGAQAPAASEAVERTAHDARDFDSYALPVGRFGPGGQRPVRAVEGAVERTAWRLDAGRASVAGVIGGHRDRLREQGFEPVWQCAGEGCGGFDFRFGAEILPPPGMLVDVRDFAQLSARRAEPEAFVSVLVSRVLDEIYVQTVTVGPADAAPMLAPTGPRAPDEPPKREAAPKTALETAPGPAGVTPGLTTSDPAAETTAATAPGPTLESAEPRQDERALLAALRRDGHVPVPGLDFETGGARLSPSSSSALDMLARLLLGNGGLDADLEVLIVGHSDDEGPLELNIDLSRRRAEAVMQALVERGVPAARLEAHGAGFLAPVATNTTEEGRAANRRVELVLR